RDPGGEPHGYIACKLIDSERQASALRASEVYLHDHRHGPAQRLVHSKEHVRHIDPEPPVGKNDDERNRKPEKPAEDKHLLASNTLGDSRGKKVEDRFGNTEADDEGNDGGLRDQAEFLLADQRDDSSFQPHHHPNKGINHDQQQELAEILPNPEAHARFLATGARHSELHAPFLLPCGRRCGGGRTTSPGLSARNWNVPCPIIGGMMRVSFSTLATRKKCPCRCIGCSIMLWFVIFTRTQEPSWMSMGSALG